MIQSQGGFVQRNNQGWGEAEEGQPNPNPQQQGSGGQPQQANGNGQAYGERQGGGRDDQGGRPEQSGREEQGDSEPGLGGVAFLQNGRNAPSDSDNDPSADEQPDVPEFTPATGRRG